MKGRWQRKGEGLKGGKCGSFVFLCRVGRLRFAWREAFLEKPLMSSDILQRLIMYFPQ